MYGALLTSRYGRAPSDDNRRSSVSTFARYVVFDSDQGVAVPAPKSSLSAITGVAHPEEATARRKRRSAWSAIPAGSAGFCGVPTRLFRCMSQ